MTMISSWYCVFLLLERAHPTKSLVIFSDRVPTMIYSDIQKSKNILLDLVLTLPRMSTVWKLTLSTEILSASLKELNSHCHTESTKFASSDYLNMSGRKI